MSYLTRYCGSPNFPPREWPSRCLIFQYSRTLIARTQFALCKLGIDVYLVRETGSVECMEATAQRPLGVVEPSEQ